MTPIVRAVKRLMLLKPEYFQQAPGRVPHKAYPLPRPNLLTDSTFDGLSVREAITPVRLGVTPVATWFDRYSEVVEEYLDLPADDRRLVVADFAARASLNTRQRIWFFPGPVLMDVTGPALLLNFCLCGAMVAGAQVKELSSTCFTLEFEGVEWGVKEGKDTQSGVRLYPLPHRSFVTGGFGKHGSSRNATLVRAYAAADRAGDHAAKEILTGLYWNISESVRLDTLLNGNQGE